MGIWHAVKRAFLGNLRIARDPRTLEDVIRETFGGGETESGEYVSDERAMRCAAVYACVRVLAESVAQLPLMLYRSREDGGKDRLVDHPLYRLLHYQPNLWQTSFEFREYAMAALLLRGNFYALKNMTGPPERAKLVELLPIHPAYVSTEQDERWRLRYTIRFPGKGAQEVPEGNILHVRGLSMDGVTGLSPISYMRESIGLSIAAEKHGARVFKNGARPGGVLTTPKTLSDEAFKRLKEEWQEAFSGRNVHRTAILEEGTKWEKMGMTNEDAQYLETRKFQRSEIAGIFRVPAHLINDLEKATFSNIEHQSQSFVSYSLTPWLVRFEQVFWRDLLTEQEKRDGLYVKFNVDGLLRGDAKSRAEALKIQREWGIINANEWRALEEMNPRDGGDVYLTPMNMRRDGEDPEDAGQRETGGRTQAPPRPTRPS